ncbi:uncharacterized protein K452DRAFT_312989 [Aplosporella prunicola CBS 121167]|uniref:C2H2-type domain-containing protein n=1 Tax=Aplosporella prunicola CBS 121167 TaxID=1176127 RepID=A0A6A6AYL5_9PEZI|nr:uncharacterized protein K452DRAFT_312989 [Aplosporella prunicola CBS 121167]KAF2136706.1 hypothetical protein K452DRAFT_312989 [Aplosporella prunicola CBS 121167]
MPTTPSDMPPMQNRQHRPPDPTLSGLISMHRSLAAVPCSMCGKDCPKQYNRDRHERFHCEMRPEDLFYRCKLGCEKTFHRPDYLKTHVKEDHPQAVGLIPEISDIDFRFKKLPKPYKIGRIVETAHFSVEASARTGQHTDSNSTINDSAGVSPPEIDSTDSITHSSSTDPFSGFPTSDISTGTSAWNDYNNPADNLLMANMMPEGDVGNTLTGNFTSNNPTTEGTSTPLVNHTMPCYLQGAEASSDTVLNPYSANLEIEGFNSTQEDNPFNNPGRAFQQGVMLS